MTLTGELNPAVTFYTTLNSPVLTGETNGEFNPFDFNKINTEIENAKTSEVKEKTFDSLDARFEETESDVKALVADVDVALTETNLRIATVDKSLSDYQNAIASINVNQSPKQTASGYGTVSLPVNAANGQVSASVGGNTYTQILEIDKGDWRNSFTAYGDSEITQNSAIIRGPYSSRIELSNTIEYREGKKYGMLIGAYPDGVTIWYRGTDKGYPVKKGYVKTIFDYNDLDPYLLARQSFWSVTSGATIWITKLIIVELDAQSEWDFTNLSSEELSQKYHCIFGTNSTISAGRLKAVNKNLFDGELESGTYNWTTGEKQFDTTAIRNKKIIVVLPSTEYIISNSAGITVGVYAYDANKNFIQVLSTSVGIGGRKFTTTADTFFINFKFSSTDLSIKAQMEKGATATPYEPRTYTTQYYPDVGVLRSLPNGTSDSIEDGEHVQRVKEYILQASDIEDLSTSWTYIDGVFISKPADYIGYGNTNATNGNVVLEGSKGDLATITDATESIGYIGSASYDIFFYVIAKGTYATLDEARTALTGTKLTYQLAEPIVTPVNVTGTLIGHPNGMVYWEPVLPVAGVYTASGIEVTDTDFPIDTLERIAKIDFVTGVETEVDVSQAVIAGDGLSFTHAELADGDIVFFTYYHGIEGTQPKIDVEYYDSRYVLKDSVTGKFYKVVESVANATLTRTLVEV